MQANMTVEIQLPTPAYSTGGVATQPLQNLPLKLFGRWVHVIALMFRATMTPTFSAGAIGVIGTNQVVLRCDFFDGRNLRFSGGFNALRFKEKLHTGGNRFADSDQGATTVVRTLDRVLHMGPPQLAGSPSDFAIPVGILRSGQVNITWGGVADVMTPGGTTGTVVAGSISMVARCILLDEIRIPPSYQFQTQAFAASDFIIPGRCLLTELGMYPVNNFSSTTAAFAAGDLAAVTLDLGDGPIVPGIQARDLTLAFHDDFYKGDLGSTRGELSGTTDTNEKTKNPGTPTAIASVDADFQPIAWLPEDGRLSKAFVAAQQMHLFWAGTKTTGQVLFGRNLSQPPNVVATLLLQALDGTSVKPKGNPEVRTLSKDAYQGPWTEFMPWKCKVG